MSAGQLLLAGAYIVASVALSITALFAGLKLARILFT